MTDLLLKNEKNTLTKEGILDFGKLVENDSFSYNLNELKEPFEEILKENGIESNEGKFAKVHFKT